MISFNITSLSNTHFFGDLIIRRGQTVDFKNVNLITLAHAILSAALATLLTGEAMRVAVDEVDEIVVLHQRDNNLYLRTTSVLGVELLAEVNLGRDFATLMLKTLVSWMIENGIEPDALPNGSIAKTYFMQLKSVRVISIS